MELVPVIDLLGGQVVRARRGERSRYLPSRSALCDSSEPLAVARAFLRLYPFKSLYIADLDAIQSIGDNMPAIRLLREQLPEHDIWLDAGMTSPSQMEMTREHGLKCVIGSERLESYTHFQELVSPPAGQDAILSLDFDRRGFIGPGDLLQKPECWPNTVICMTLDRVGSNEGPDYSRLNLISGCSEDKNIYAAGGIRHLDDLQQLQRAGISGALLASALHDRTIGADTLRSL